VLNGGVSSAHVWFDGVEVVAPNNFPTDAELDVPVTPSGTGDEIDVRLEGSPGDWLRIVLVDAVGTVYLDKTITREKCAPKTESFLVNLSVCGLGGGIDGGCDHHHHGGGDDGDCHHGHGGDGNGDDGHDGHGGNGGNGGCHDARTVRALNRAAAYDKRTK